MFSIIVCSIDEKHFLQLTESISNTIGKIEYELIRLNNKILNVSIAEAYNLGIKKSKHPYLVFVHEDVLFYTQAWGEILLPYFEEPEVGLIGVAGSRVKMRIPSGWWNQRSEHILMNIIQHSKSGKKERVHFGFEYNSQSEVVTIDGVFMAARKTKNIRFDERLKGFHNYDQSISLEYRKNSYKVIVTNQILIEHFSGGNKNEDWIESLLEFHKLYRTYLPQIIGNRRIKKEDKAFSCLRFIYNCRNNNKKSLAFKYWLRYLSLKPLDRKNMQMLKYFLNWK